ncbi:MAG: glycosyltransferase family 25 protein [Rhodobacteraceae bacterium]|nr:glycosyltransferase family 25 protein [Paracoccaceae bacterium]
MIPIFVLSLTDCHDRRAGMSESLTRIGLPFEFIDAIDGRHGLPPEYESQIDRVAARRAGRHLLDAEYACALSHINVYRRIAAEKIAYALVLEDDLIPKPELAEYLAGKHYEDAWLTQLYAGGIRVYVWRRQAKNLFAGYTSYLRVPEMSIDGTVATVVSYQAARHFIAHALPVDKEADWPDCIETLVAQRHCRVVHPPLITLADQYDSTIDKAGMRDKIRLRNKRFKRRFLGIVIRPFKATLGSLRRALRKPFCKRLHPASHPR